MLDENSVRPVINKVEENESILFSDENYTGSKTGNVSAEPEPETPQVINASTVRKIESSNSHRRHKSGIRSHRKAQIDIENKDAEPVSAIESEKPAIEEIVSAEEQLENSIEEYVSEVEKPEVESEFNDDLNDLINAVASDIETGNIARENDTFGAFDETVIEPETVYETYMLMNGSEPAAELSQRAAKHNNARKKNNLSKILISLAVALVLIEIPLSIHMIRSRKQNNDTAAVSPEPAVETALPSIEKTPEPDESKTESDVNPEIEETEEPNETSQEQEEAIEENDVAEELDESIENNEITSDQSDDSEPKTAETKETDEKTSDKPNSESTTNADEEETPVTTPAVVTYQVGDGPQGTAGRVYFPNGTSASADWGGNSTGLNVSRTDGFMTLISGNVNYTPSVGQTIAWYDEYGYAYTYQCTSVYTTYVQDGVVYLSDGNQLDWANYGNMAIYSNGVVSYWNII